MEDVYSSVTYKRLIGMRYSPFHGGLCRFKLGIFKDTEENNEIVNQMLKLGRICYFDGSNPDSLGDYLRRRKISRNDRASDLTPKEVKYDKVKGDCLKFDIIEFEEELNEELPDTSNKKDEELFESDDDDYHGSILSKETYEELKQPTKKIIIEFLTKIKNNDPESKPEIYYVYWFKVEDYSIMMKSEGLEKLKEIFKDENVRDFFIDRKDEYYYYAKKNNFWY